MRWRLHYSKAVISYLYGLRTAGHDLHTHIKALQDEAEPWKEANPLVDLAQWEVEHNGHWIGFEVDEANEVLTILYIEPM